VSEDADVDNLAAQTLLTMGKVDILMNNAGVALRGFVEKLTIAEWEWILGINLIGVVRGVRAFLPHMLKKGSGYIINTASGAGLVASEPPYIVLYTILPTVRPNSGLWVSPMASMVTCVLKG
jgi:NADP-dependent 3-hydroxy acid dehydrogenase YdfG